MIMNQTQPVQLQLQLQLQLWSQPSKNGPFEIWMVFKWFLTKWQPFVRISNGWACGYQIPFVIRTICKPTFFEPFKIQTSPDFRSPQYFDLCCTQRYVISITINRLNRMKALIYLQVNVWILQSRLNGIMSIANQMFPHLTNLIKVLDLVEYLKKLFLKLIYFREDLNCRIQPTI